MGEGIEKEVCVLILDDEEYVLKLANREFRDESYGYIATTDPDEAMAILADKNIKVVISDQRMPKMTGIEFLAQVKEKYPDTVRILFSGYQDIQVTEAAINVGQVYRYVTKPWEPGALRPVVQQSLDCYDLVDENKGLMEFLGSKNRELEALNNGLEGMVKRQKQFTSIVSHELRTPLASINSNLDLVLMETPGALNEDQKKFLLKSKRNVDNLNQLVNEMLDLSKIDIDQKQLDKSSCDLKEVIDDVVYNFVNVAESKNLTLKSDVPDGLPSMFIDAKRIGRVLKNLINNAIKFTDEGGITVSCIYQEDKKCVLVCLEDTGKGICDEDKGKLFQKFRQVGEGQNQADGTGLGLAISQEIVNLHGGKIWVESQYSKGSRFYFTLPVQKRSVSND